MHLGDPLVAAGVGDAADADDADALARSLARARRALAAVGGGLRAYDDLGGGLDALLDPAAADAWAVALLAPLDRPGERADLVASLRAWLARHGQWDAAAADLGVHRHTCATGCGASRSCSGARWTTRTCAPSCGWPCAPRLIAPAAPAVSRLARGSAPTVQHWNAWPRRGTVPLGA